MKIILILIEYHIFQFQFKPFWKVDNKGRKNDWNNVKKCLKEKKIVNDTKKPLGLKKNISVYIWSVGVIEFLDEVYYTKLMSF